MCGHYNECGCRAESYHRQHGDDCECGCHSGAGFRRRFPSRAEQVEALKAYLRELEAEAAGVRERLAAWEAAA